MRSSLLNRSVGLAVGITALAAGSAHAFPNTINWMNMAPTPFGSPVPNNSVFSLPGVGSVTVTYSIPATFSQARFQNPLFQNGNVNAGNETWTSQELLGVVNNVSAQPIVGVPWRITYTFSSVQAPGTIYLGVSGLGQTTSFGGGATIATVNQNGTYLGDWTGGGNYGATQFTGGVGTFSMQNSVTGAGGADPWWNTGLAVTSINDPILSLTVDFAQIAGDGVGVNIGSVVPAPGALALIGASGTLALRRRRR
jgi:hypothetical protein